MTLMSNKIVTNVKYFRHYHGEEYSLQIIPVNLKLQLDTIGSAVQDNVRYQALNVLFAHYVISRFDLGVCRVTLRWDLGIENKKANLPPRSLISYELTCTPDASDASADRIEKYANRAKERRRRLASLSSLSLYALFRDEKRYVKIEELESASAVQSGNEVPSVSQQ